MKKISLKQMQEFAKEFEYKIKYIIPNLKSNCYNVNGVTKEFLTTEGEKYIITEIHMLFISLFSSKSIKSQWVILNKIDVILRFVKANDDYYKIREFFFKLRDFYV